MGSNSASAISSAASKASPQRFVLPVQGMTCAACVAHVEKALAAGNNLEQMRKDQLLAPWSKQYSGSFVSADAFLETLYNSLSRSGHTPFVPHN